MSAYIKVRISMRKAKFQFLASTLLTFSMVQAIAIGLSDHHLDQQAYAKSSAGRSSGGSFTRSSPSNSSKPSSPPPSSTRDSFSSSQSPNQSPSQPPNRNNTIVAPVIINNDSSRPYNPPSNSYQSTTSSNASSSGLPWYVWLIILLMGGAATYFIIRALFFHSKSGSTSDLGNDTFTISKLQVALLAQAREVQARLTELSLEVDTDTPEGLMTLMQESAIALIRTPENWTHASTSSQSVPSSKAEEVFNKLSFAERSKFSEETLVNVSGRVAKRQEAIASPDKDPSAYIVVTLLVGTEHDKPLFGEVKNTQDLQKALEAIASIPISHLLVFELLWSPQADSDSLTYDELLTEYSNMIQI